MNAGLDAARSALAGRRAWLVGGAVRDRVLGRPSCDVDVIVEGDPAEAARAVKRAVKDAACFSLSEDFGAWRVVARDHSWQVDVDALRAPSLEQDLTLRDFTVNAIAEPIGGGAPIDPLGGLEDLAARRLRAAAPSAFADDPLRVLRLVRMAIELGLEPDDRALHDARASAPALAGCAGERIFMELRRIVAAQETLRGLELMAEVGATAAVLPELDELRGVEQSRFHHTDVYGHTLEVLERVIPWTVAPQAHPAELTALVGESGAQAAAFLAEPLADGLTRGQALRWGALLHDVAKPATRAIRPADGRVTFIGHDQLGAGLAREMLGRLRTSERLRAHLADLVRHHLRLGFLVHEPQPLARRTVFSYLRACSHVAVDVTLLSVADRLATRGERAGESIDAHLGLARPMLADALRWHTKGSPEPLARGDELVRELGVPAGPRIGELLEELAGAQYAGEVTTREQAVAHARAWAQSHEGSE